MQLNYTSRLHSAHWVRSALAARASNTQECKFTKRTEDQSTAGTTAMSESMAGGKFIELTAAIVSAYVSNNSVPTADLPALIGQMHSALAPGASRDREMPNQPPQTAISGNKSGTPDHILSL